MCKRKMFKKCMLLAVLLIAAPNCFAGAWYGWTNDNSDQEWLEPTNWKTGWPNYLNGVPIAGDTAVINKVGSQMPVLDSLDGSCFADKVGIGMWDPTFNPSNLPGEMRMTGGSLTFTGGEYYQLMIGYYVNDNGTLYMDGGSINVTARITVGQSIWGPGGIGHIIMTNGSIINSYTGSDAIGLGIGTGSYIDLSGGLIEAESLMIIDSGYINITGTGALVLRNVYTTTDVDALMAAGSIRGTDLQVIRDGAKITITPIPEPCTLALLGIAGSLVVLRKRSR